MTQSGSSPQPWYADGLRFTCTQCGRCCGGAPGYVWVNQAEIAALARLRQLDVDEFSRRHVRRVGLKRSLLERENGDCEFLARDADGRARCTVYEARPMQCRTWPFWSSNLRTLANWRAASRGCPGMDTGQHHPLPVIQEALARNGDLPL